MTILHLNISGNIEYVSLITDFSCSSFFSYLPVLHASVVHCFSDFLGDYSKHPELIIFYLELMQYTLYILHTVQKRDVLFIMGDWNAKVGSQEIFEVTGKFSFGIQNEEGQRLTEFCQENALVIANTLFQQHMR